MKTEPEEKDGWTRQEDAARVVDLADPTRGDDANEFQGHHLGGCSLASIHQVADKDCSRKLPIALVRYL